MTRNFKEDIPIKIAVGAYNGTSFSPEKRGDSAITSWVEYMTEDLAFVTKVAGETSELEFERYHKRAKELYLAWLYSRSNVMSAMITGPARFPSARNEKRWRWADNHWNKFSEFREYAKKAIVKKFKVPVNELETAKKDLKRRESNQILMKATNKIVKSKKLSVSEKEDELKKLGFSITSINNLMTPDYCNRTGYASFSLTSVNLKIKRLKEKITMLEAKEALATSDEPIKLYYEGNGFKIVANFDDDRYQVLFDEKPEPEVRTILKSNGFKWAPSKTAWQRAITDNAKRSIDRNVINPLKDIYN